MSWASDLVAEMLLTLQNLFSTSLFEGKSWIWPSKEMSRDFVWGQSVAETCFGITYHWNVKQKWHVEAWIIAGPTS